LCFKDFELYLSYDWYLNHVWYVHWFLVLVYLKFIIWYDGMSI
jgi:hypothetical protein